MSTSSGNNNDVLPSTRLGENVINREINESFNGQDRTPPFEAKRSADELKFRLASAVSAKIALGKDGRNTSNNRGVGLLLQRKEQQSSRLNTKDIKFKKAVPENRTENDSRNDHSAKDIHKNGLSNTDLQKSLLNALMSSRQPSGAGAGQGRQIINNLIDTRSINVEKGNKTKVNDLQQFYDGTSENVADNLHKSQLENRIIHGQYQSKKSDAYKGENDNNNFDCGEGSVPPNDSTRKNDASILERAKHIQRLLGHKTQEESAVESISNGKGNGVPSKKSDFNETPKEVETTGKTDAISKPLGFSSNTKFAAGNFKMNVENTFKAPPTVAVIKNTEYNNVARGTEAGKVFEKKVPPPVAKKPPRIELGKMKKDNSPSDKDLVNMESGSFSNPVSLNCASPGSNGVLADTRYNPVNPQHSIEYDKGFEQDRGNSAKKIAVNDKNSNHVNEDLLEKLEAGIGACKIVAFKVIEDFSVLRVKVNRARGELDQLIRDREKGES